MNLKWTLISLTIAVALFALLVGGGAFGGTLPEAQLQADMAELPPCVAARINSRLKHVVLTNHLQEVFPGTDGDSFGFGTMFLDDTLPPPLLRIVFFHECGHFYDWASGNPSQSQQFKAALNDDFAAMPPFAQFLDSYLIDPQEAFAELFAQHFAGADYNKRRHYQLQYFSHTASLVEGDICK